MVFYKQRFSLKKFKWIISSNGIELILVRIDCIKIKVFEAMLKDRKHTRRDVCFRH